VTAIAIGARSDYAFLAADAAVFGKGGVVDAFRRKILQLPHLNAVVSWSGVAIDDEPVRDHAAQFSTAGRYFEDLPRFAESIRDELAGPEHTMLLDGAAKICIFYIAHFDRRRGTPMAVQVLPEGGRIRAPFVAHTVRTGGQPGAAIRDFPQLDPKRDLIAFMEAARAVPTGTGYPGCAGWVDMARVSAKGISLRRVHRWADRVRQLPGAAEPKGVAVG
jgi:hypothetical protein